MAEMNKISESQRMTVDERGNWQYPSAAESGHTEIELPTLPGSPNAVERLHVRDFGVHVIGAIDRSMTRQGYMKSGPQQGPVEVFAHYCAVAEGTSLLTNPHYS